MTGWWYERLHNVIKELSTVAFSKFFERAVYLSELFSSGFSALELI